MAVKQRVFKTDRSNASYTATLAKGVVKVCVNNNGAQGNNAVVGIYDPERHLWQNDNGRKVLPCSIKKQIERAFKPLDVEIAEQNHKAKLRAFST